MSKDEKTNFRTNLDDKIVQGIVLGISAADLAAHCLTRAEYHRARAKFYETEAKRASEMRLQMQIDTPDGQGGKFASTYNNSNDAALENANKSATHARRAVFFEFTAKHVILGVTYYLSPSELAQLDLSPT